MSRGVGMIFFVRGPNSGCGAKRHSLNFLAHRAKTLISKNVRFAHQIFLKLLNSFLISNFFSEYFV